MYLFKIHPRDSCRAHSKCPELHEFSGTETILPKQQLSKIALGKNSWTGPPFEIFSPKILWVLRTWIHTWVHTRMGRALDAVAFHSSSSRLLCLAPSTEQRSAPTNLDFCRKESRGGEKVVLVKEYKVQLGRLGCRGIRELMTL